MRKIDEEKFKILDDFVSQNPKLKKEIEELQTEARVCLKEFMENENGKRRNN
jgi:hypothetical protein